MHYKVIRRFYHNEDMAEAILYSGKKFAEALRVLDKEHDLMLEQEKFNNAMKVKESLSLWCVEEKEILSRWES